MYVIGERKTEHTTYTCPKDAMKTIFQRIDIPKFFKDNILFLNIS
jgi:hypothetical protein